MDIKFIYGNKSLMLGPHPQAKDIWVLAQPIYNVTPLPSRHQSYIAGGHDQSVFIFI